MINLTTILIAAACLLIGAGLGHLFSRKTPPGDQSVADLQQKLEQTEQQLKRYQHEVTQHFVEVSNLTTNMTQSYRKIHEHLATSAIRLANPEIGRQLLKAGGSQLSLTDEDGNPLLNPEDLEPPRDYAPKVPGGVLSEDYGLSDNDDKSPNSGDLSTDAGSDAHGDASGNAHSDSNSDVADDIDMDDSDPTDRVV